MMRGARGFTLAEVLIAFMVVLVLSAAMIQTVGALRSFARSTGEYRLASGIAQGALERVRSMPLEQWAGPVVLNPPLPEEAMTLADADLRIGVEEWEGHPGLYRLTAVVEWRSRRGVVRRIKRGMLMGRNHAR